MDGKYKVLAVLAFNQLEHRLKGVPKLKLEELKDLEDLSGLPRKAALFVTWQIRGRLRGCIGTFQPQPLELGVRSYADCAAFEDTRFNPISAKDLPQLDVCVTLLGPLEPIAGTTDWEIGVHGLRGEFPGGWSSTFLPDVAEEQGWDHVETIEMLADKAEAPASDGVKLWRYTGTKARLTFQEYRDIVDAM